MSFAGRPCSKPASLARRPFLSSSVRPHGFLEDVHVQRDLTQPALTSAALRGGFNPEESGILAHNHAAEILVPGVHALDRADTLIPGEHYKMALVRPSS